jgi:hypothetical protein
MDCYSLAYPGSVVIFTKTLSYLYEGSLVFTHYYPS